MDKPNISKTGLQKVKNSTSSLKIGPKLCIPNPSARSSVSQTPHPQVANEMSFYENRIQPLHPSKSPNPLSLKTRPQTPNPQVTNDMSALLRAERSVIKRVSNIRSAVPVLQEASASRDTLKARYGSCRCRVCCRGFGACIPSRVPRCERLRASWRLRMPRCER